MILYGTCGHTFNWPDKGVHPESVKCAQCGRSAVYGVDLKTAAPNVAMNHGENRYRQIVLGQGPLPGYPTITRDGYVGGYHAEYCSPGSPGWTCGCEDDRKGLASLAARIASLLPPEKT